jgi:hypothetical protein
MIYDEELTDMGILVNNEHVRVRKIKLFLKSHPHYTLSADQQDTVRHRLHSYVLLDCPHLSQTFRA